jgi:hypothetical protein
MDRQMLAALALAVAGFVVLFQYGDGVLRSHQDVVATQRLDRCEARVAGGRGNVVTCIIEAKTGGVAAPATAHTDLAQNRSATVAR